MGETEGACDGFVDGDFVGNFVGLAVGLGVGPGVGLGVGLAVGFTVGLNVGRFVGGLLLWHEHHFPVLLSPSFSLSDLLLLLLCHFLCDIDAELPISSFFPAAKVSASVASSLCSCLSSDIVP